MHARTLRMCVREPRRVTHSNKLATVLTTVQADICDGKLWTKGGTAREGRRGEQGREREREGKRENQKRGTRLRPPPPLRPVVSVRYVDEYIRTPPNYFIYELFHLSGVF